MTAPRRISMDATRPAILITPESVHWADGHGALRRNPARDHGASQNQSDGHAITDRITRPDRVELTLEQPCHQHCGGQPAEATGQRESQSLPEHLAHHPPGIGTERTPHAELMTAI